MKQSWRGLVFFGMIALTVLSCWFLSNTKTDPVAGVVVWLPVDLPGHVSRLGQMGPEEKEWLPSDTTFYKKTYVDAELIEGAEREAARYRMMGGEKNLIYAKNVTSWAWSQGVSATLIVAGSDSRSLHRPQVCLTAQHWTIERREIVKLQTKGGPLEVMDFHLVRTIRNADGSVVEDENGNARKTRAHYVYWWIGPDVSTPSDEKRVLFEVWNSILKGRRERWAYPSLMVYVDEKKGREDARERAFAFIEEFAPDFQKSLGAKWREGAVPLKEIGAN